ncbi:unnamed protein product [Symbiodinium natans]|uniref:NYN domain-containing protein n=1 Tax=Symbiodinium natans TaxID=878477 RepID=A0A812QYR2_9DINO|nr:unnamed protein product [Symbiodinium natans]
MQLPMIFGACWQVRRRQYQLPSRTAARKTSARSKNRAELLVDGDQRGIDATKEAIERLQQDGRKVQTRVFAAPKSVENKKWQEFFSEPGTKFQAVPRSKNGEASDLAIEERLRCLARTSRSVCPALLTTDTDFLGVVQDIVEMGREMVLLVPQGAVSSWRKYELSGARVLLLESGRTKQNGPKVRAQLHANGGGTVELTESR